MSSRSSRPSRSSKESIGSVVCRSDAGPQRRPLPILVQWANALVQQRPRSAGDLHLVFSDGHTLCLLLERLRPGTRLCKFNRAVTRTTALANLEQALSLVWNHLPSPAAMPSAAQILDGAPREINLRFIDQLYSIFVARPARARLPGACRWLNEMLATYQLRLSDTACKPPHTTLGPELRSCVALAILLHTCLPASRVAELQGAVYWQPESEVERVRSVRVVLTILERERLSPCTAEEFLAGGRPVGATPYRGPLCAASSASASSANYYPLRSAFSASTTKAVNGPASPRGASWAGGAGRGYTTPSSSSIGLGHAAAAGGEGWGAAGASGVLLTGGPQGGPELESELLCIMLSAAYNRFARAAPSYGTAGERRLLEFKDGGRHRALPASKPPPTPAPVEVHPHMYAARADRYAPHPGLVDASAAEYLDQQPDYGYGRPDCGLGHEEPSDSWQDSLLHGNGMNAYAAPRRYQPPPTPGGESQEASICAMASAGHAASQHHRYDALEIVPPQSCCDPAAASPRYDGAMKSRQDLSHPFGLGRGGGPQHAQQQPQQQQPQPQHRANGFSAVASALLAEVDDYLLDGNPPAAEQVPPPLAPPTPQAVQPPRPHAAPTPMIPPSADPYAERHALAQLQPRSTARSMPAPVPEPEPAPSAQGIASYMPAWLAWEGGVSSQQQAPPAPPRGSENDTPAPRLAPRNLGFSTSRAAAPTAQTAQQAPREPVGTDDGTMPARPPQLGSGKPRQPRPTKAFQSTHQPQQPERSSHSWSQLSSSAPTPVSFPYSNAAVTVTAEPAYLQ